MDGLRVGMELIHKTQKIKCEIIEITEDELKIKLYKPIAGDYILKLPKYLMGEFLFLDEEHMSYSLEKLAAFDEYKYNRNLVKNANTINSIKEALSKEVILTDEEKDNSKKIKAILQKRKIEHLIHFTNMKNLESILNIGILDRQELFKHRIDYSYNDVSRYDGKSNCSCFSIEFPNDFLLNNFRFNNRGGKWVILVVKPEVLLECNREIYYCYDNAAIKEISNKISDGLLQKSEDFENMFMDKYEFNYTTRSGVINRSDNKYLKDFLPTASQAEILIGGGVGTKYIEGVIFESEDDLNTFINSSYKKNLLEKYNYIIHSDYFTSRKDVRFGERN